MPGIADFVNWVNVSLMVVIAAVFLWVVVTYITKLMPLLEGIKQNSALSNVNIDNNTKAFNELAKSNENVAKALELLTSTLTQQADSLKRHESDAQRNFTRAFDILDKHTEAISDLSEKVTKVSEKVNTCTNLQHMKLYHGE